MLNRCVGRLKKGTWRLETYGRSTLLILEKWDWKVKQKRGVFGLSLW